MERTRKNFGYLTAKVYAGKPGAKTVGIHIDRKSYQGALLMARAILAAIEYGKGVDITLWTSKPLKDGSTRITITAPK